MDFLIALGLALLIREDYKDCYARPRRLSPGAYCVVLAEMGTAIAFSSLCFYFLL